MTKARPWLKVVLPGVVLVALICWYFFSRSTMPPSGVQPASTGSSVSSAAPPSPSENSLYEPPPASRPDTAPSREPQTPLVPPSQPQDGAASPPAAPGPLAESPASARSARIAPGPAAPRSPPPLSVARPPGASPLPAPPAESAPKAAADAGEELDALRFMVRDYRSVAGENPVGTNAEITEALMGANKKGAHFATPETARLNDRGEWLDGWGTPYFFHQLGAQDMEIRSAGPDRALFTADDLVTK